MEDPSLAYEDMLFFERRLTEVISGMQPRVRIWRVILTLAFLMTACSAYYWISDPSLKSISLLESLVRHPMFTACTSLLIILFIFFGVHKRVVAPKIIATRCRTVLGDFCLSCDEYGKLIVRPAYSPSVSPINKTPSKHTNSNSSSLNLAEEDALLMPEQRGLWDIAERCFGEEIDFFMKGFLLSQTVKQNEAVREGEGTNETSLFDFLSSTLPPNLNSQILKEQSSVIYNKLTTPELVIQLLGNNNGTVTNQQQNNSAFETMFLVDKKGLEKLQLDEFLGMLLLGLSVSFIVIGGAIPYVFQYTEIYRRKSAAGFSLLVCLALCLANILRIEFWFGKRFEIPLLVQSIVMLLVMFAMLEISVRMNRRMVPITQRTSVWNGDFVESFWKWNDLSSFFMALLLFTAIVSLLNATFFENAYFIETLGMSALLVEACLGIPQLVRNFQRKSTVGMSVKMVLMWFIGDVGKTLYFVVRKSPAQFWICSCLQITIDVLILLQVWAYGRRSSNSAHGSRIPSYVSNSTSKI